MNNVKELPTKLSLYLKAYAAYRQAMASVLSAETISNWRLFGKTEQEFLNQDYEERKKIRALLEAAEQPIQKRLEELKKLISKEPIKEYYKAIEANYRERKTRIELLVEDRESASLIAAWLSPYYNYVATPNYDETNKSWYVDIVESYLD